MPPIADACEFAPLLFLFRHSSLAPPCAAGLGKLKDASAGEQQGGGGCKRGGAMALDGGTRESLQHAIKDLASIAHPADDPPCRGTVKSPSVVHIMWTGVTPTLMDLLLSALHVLSRANAFLHKNVQWIVLDHCDIVCVGKHGNAKGGWRQSNIDRLLLQKVSKPPGGRCNVQLKGGNPFLFMRTRTKIDALRSSSTLYTYTPECLAASRVCTWGAFRLQMHQRNARALAYGAVSKRLGGDAVLATKAAAVAMPTWSDDRLAMGHGCPCILHDWAVGQAGCAVQVHLKLRHQL
jgi:hypothetical protein